MQILENLISAFSVLRGSKLRTILTLLGITIGIAGVIAMMSFGAGAEKLMMGQIENIGGPSMFGVYRPGYIEKNNRWQRNTSPHYLEMRDLHDILTECPSVEVATVERSHPIDFEVEGKHRQTYLRATTNEYQAVRRWQTEYGRFIADTDMDFWNKVCVIGAKVWKEQFKGQNPIGEEVGINNRRFTVIGIMESRGDGFEEGRSEDEYDFHSDYNRTNPFWRAQSGWCYHGARQEHRFSGSGTERSENRYHAQSRWTTIPFSERGRRKKELKAEKGLSLSWKWCSSSLRLSL